MKASDKIDAARIDLLLGELRLPGIKLTWAALAETADKEGWPAARLLAALAEQEMVERSRRRFGRHLEEASIATIRRIEAKEGPMMGYVSTLMWIHSAFEQAGIRFLGNEPGGGIGVRLVAPKP